MPTPFLPYQRDPIAGGLTTPNSWYQFFSDLRQFLIDSGLDTGIIDQILARLDELEQNQIGAFVIQGLVSVDVFGTPQGGVVQVQLENDVDAPGNNYYYGTSDTGVKGWFNSASNLKIASLTGSTYTTVQDFVNTMHSPGVITGGEITDLGGGNVRIMAGTMMIRVADDDVSSLPFANFAQTDFAVPNDQLTRFFGVVYNAGSPVVEMRTVYDWNKDTEIPLGSAVRLSTTITNVTPNKYRMGDPITNVIQRFDAQSPAIRDNSIGGLLIGETGVRNVTLTAGKIWSRLSDFDSAAKNSSVDTMLSVFFNGVNLTVTSGVTQWDNMNINTGGALVVMGNNKWANLWFFISIDGTKYGYAYGTAEHNSLGAAASEGLPFYLTQNFFNQTLLLGRFVFQKGAATAGLIESAFTSVFNTSAVNNHNDLAGLQGGAVGEYFHLTTLQNTDVTNLSAGGTNAQFWRGDKVYSNELEGPFSARATTDTATLGAELVTNGTFTGSAAGWTLGTDWAYVANNVAVTLGGTPGTLSQSLAIVSGQRYLVAWQQQHSVSNNAFITPSIGAASGVATAYNNTGNNNNFQIITAVASGVIPVTFTVTPITGAGTVTIDAVSVVAISTIANTIELENVSGTIAGEGRGYLSTTNQAYGLNAGRSITSGTNNSLLGTLAGSDITTGGSNVFVGSGAGEKTTTGTGNTFIGRNAGNRSTTGNASTYIGNQAGENAGTGGSNTFIGSLVGQNNGVGSSNVFVGNQAGQANVSGTSNVFLGVMAGVANTSGGNLTCVGRMAGLANTTGGSNNYFGTNSGTNNTVGQNNLFFGNSAGQFQADGVTPLTDPEQSLYIGNATRGLNNSDANSIVIGHQSIGRGANTAQWGNTSILNHYFSGNVNVNTSSIVHLGAGVIGLGNATTVPSVNPVGGGVMYAEAGAAKWRGSGGTITTFGPADPHCPICSSDFVHEWENPKYGYLAVCMNCHCDGINSHTRVKGAWSTHS